MVAHGLAPRDLRATLAKVARLSSARAEGVATLFRGTVETVVQQAILANANVDLLARHSQTNRELNALCAVARAEQRLRGSLLDELIGGNVGDSARLRDRAGHLGYDLTVPHALLVFDLDRPLTATASPSDRDATARAVMWRLRASLRQRWRGSIVAARDAAT
jgi:hypothetical protein